MVVSFITYHLKKDESIFPSGFLFGIDRDTWKWMGGFNESFRTGNEDVDFGLRMLHLPSVKIKNT